MPPAVKHSHDLPQAVAEAVLLSNVANCGKSNRWRFLRLAAKLDGRRNVMPVTDHKPMTWLAADRLGLVGLFVFGFLLRGGLLWARRANLQPDPDAYREIAENLLKYGEFALGQPSPDDGVSHPAPTAYRPPLYPIL